jgi:hypothetical protein
MDNYSYAYGYDVVGISFSFLNNHVKNYLTKTMKEQKVCFKGRREKDLTFVAINNIVMKNQGDLLIKLLTMHISNG